jgi:hypothetical protein
VATALDRRVQVLPAPRQMAKLHAVEHLPPKAGLSPQNNGAPANFVFRV